MYMDFPIEVNKTYGQKMVYSNINSYMNDTLEECFYDRGQIERIDDKVSNLINTLSNLIDFLYYMDIIKIDDIPTLLGNTDKICKLK